MRGHGAATALHPETLRVLHIEPSYLCQLACPQCIAPKVRLRTKKPPYYMSLPFFEALLRQLREDGVQRIRMVHFEGRGDPLLNQSLGEMVRHTKALYLDSFTAITSHGNYPFKPWLLESGLDLLRLSIDGAFVESYARYRVGGRLQATLDLMRAIRDAKRRLPSRLRVEWKYILFEWNDGDEEIREAARLADELEADLRFCLTHTPGKSQRFPSLAVLGEALAELAPRATRTLTFQLKEDSRDADIRHLRAEHAEGWLLAALHGYGSGDIRAGRAALIEGLTFDPGLDRHELERGGEVPSRAHLSSILAQALSPSTLSALANLHLVLRDLESAERLFQGYLRLAPDAPDRDKVERMLLDLRMAIRPERGAGYGLFRTRKG